MSMFGNWMGQTDGQPKQTQPTQAQQNPPQNGGNPPSQQTNQQTNPENNGGTNDDLIANIWAEQKPQGQGDGPLQQTLPPNGQTPPAQRTDDQLRGEVSAHLGQVGLGNMELTAADVEKLTGENSHQEFANLLNTRIQQSYLQAIQTSQKLINQILEKKLPEAISEAVNQSKAFFNGGELRSALIKDMPWVDDPAIKPMAETVMRQFLVKGATREKAIELTKQYFERVRSAMDPEYVPPSASTRTTFRGNPRTAINFVDVLKGN